MVRCRKVAIGHGGHYLDTVEPGEQVGRSEAAQRRELPDDLLPRFFRILIAANSRRLGHASMSFTLDRYGHLMPDAGAQAAAAVAALVDGAASSALQESHHGRRSKEPRVRPRPDLL